MLQPVTILVPLSHRCGPLPLLLKFIVHPSRLDPVNTLPSLPLPGSIRPISIDLMNEKHLLSQPEERKLVETIWLLLPRSNDLGRQDLSETCRSTMNLRLGEFEGGGPLRNLSRAKLESKILRLRKNLSVYSRCVSTDLYSRTELSRGMIRTQELQFSLALKDFHDTLQIGVQRTLVAEDGMGHAYCKVRQAPLSSLSMPH